MDLWIDIHEGLKLSQNEAVTWVGFGVGELQFESKINEAQKCTVPMFVVTSKSKI